jgi:hypothetical protein
MPNVTVNDFFEVKIACWQLGQLGLSIRHYIAENVIGAFDPTGPFATQLAVALAPDYAAVMNDTGFFLGVSARNMTALPAAAAVPSTTGETQGTIAGSPLPGQTSGIITLTTGLRGRSRRGRAYIPFPAAVFNDAATDTPSNAYQVLLASIAVTLRNTQNVVAGGSSVDLVPIVLSQDADTPPSPLFAFITGTTVRAAWATQRRRGNYGAANPRVIPL